jgi:hypothetical protein
MVQIKEIYKKKKDTVDLAQSKELMNKLRKEHEKLVKGMFEFIDAQGGWLDFAYRFFPEDNIMQIRLTHQEICELPMGIVKHLNNTYKKVRRFSNEIDPNARGIPSTYEIQSRVRFTPINVM